MINVSIRALVSTAIRPLVSMFPSHSTKIPTRSLFMATSAAAAAASAAPVLPAANLSEIAGFTNYSEAEMYAFTRLKERIRTAYESRGFTPIELRPLEYKDNLQRKGGIGKQMYGVYRMADDTFTDLAIPFDRTVPLAIYVASHPDLTLPYKRYDINHSYRGEHAQKGRFRAFYQCDVDILDKRLTIGADFDCIRTIAAALDAMEIGAYTIQINHIVLAKSIIAMAGIPKEVEGDVLRIVDKLDKLTPAEVIAEIVKLVPAVSPEEITKMIDKFNFSGTLDEFIATCDFKDEGSLKAIGEVKELFEYFEVSGFPSDHYRINPGMVRGLDYYTGIVFETFLNGKERFGSIASGGRYDDLVDVFTKSKSTDKKLEGVGGSIGLTRLFAAMSDAGMVHEKRKTITDILCAFRTSVLARAALAAAEPLRKMGFRAEWVTDSNLKIGKQLDYASKKGIPFVLMVMDTNSYVLRNLKTKEQKDLPTLEDALEEAKTFVTVDSAEPKSTEGEASAAASGGAAGGAAARS